MARWEQTLRCLPKLNQLFHAMESPVEKSPFDGNRPQGVIMYQMYQ